MDLFQIEEVLCDSCPQESKDKTGTLTFSRLKEILSPENTYETLFFSLRKAINIHSVVKCNSVECIFVSWENNEDVINAKEVVREGFT